MISVSMMLPNEVAQSLLAARASLLSAVIDPTVEGDEDIVRVQAQARAGLGLLLERIEQELARIDGLLGADRAKAAQRRAAYARRKGVS